MRKGGNDTLKESAPMFKDLLCPEMLIAESHVVCGIGVIVVVASFACMMSFHVGRSSMRGDSLASVQMICPICIGAVGSYV